MSMLEGSDIPLTELNLQNLQRSHQYGSNIVGESGLMASALDGLLDGPTNEPSSTPYLTPEDANGIVSGLLQQYYHVQEWNVPWPRPMTTPLLYVPDAITEAFAAPKAPTLADLEAMGLGLVESIPLTHDLLYPEQERLRSQLSRRMDSNLAKVSEIGLHAPYQTAKERNPDLPDEDFALIDVDFCSSGHGQRHLPSITFLQRPSYTEIGLTPAERREDERRQALAQSMAPVLNPSVASAAAAPLTLGSTGGLSASSLSVNGSGNGGISQWNLAVAKTFKHAKQLDVCYEKWVSDAATLKLGLIPVHGHDSPLNPSAINKLTIRIMNIVGYITANGVVLGTRRNDTNQSFYNTQQGKFVGALFWSGLCSLAAEAWGAYKKKNNNTNNTSGLLNLPAATIVARILDDAEYETLALGSEEEKQALAAVLEDVVESYTIALKQTVAANKKAPCPLVHTAEDFARPTNLAKAVLPVAIKLVYADASAQRTRTNYESLVSAPLRLATNLDLHATLAKIADAGDASRRMTKTVVCLSDNSSGGGADNDNAEDNGVPPSASASASAAAAVPFRIEELTKPNGAVPLAVMPVFPEGFQRFAADPTVPFHAYDLANQYRDVQHVVLNGERNSFIPGAYAPAATRAPSVLFNDRLHFKAVSYDNEPTLGEKRNRRGNASSSTGPSPAETTAYTTGTTQSKFEKYLADHSSTISYVLKVQPNTDGDDDSANNFLGPVVTYTRVPTLTRYKRAQARITAEDVLKTVTVCWSPEESAAREEQLSLVNNDEDEDEAQEEGGEHQEEAHRAPSATAAAVNTTTAKQEPGVAPQAPQ